MCGELAGNPLATLLLLGMGLQEFSMSPSSVPKIKKIIRRVAYEEAKNIAEKALSMDQAEEIKDYLMSCLEALELSYLLDV
jgi:phosphotransferase system enzyme I (PtsI)